MISWPAPQKKALVISKIRLFHASLESRNLELGEEMKFELQLRLKTCPLSADLNFESRRPKTST